MPERAAVAKQLLDQAAACRALGSPMYALLLEHSAADVLAGGPCWEALEPAASLPHGKAVPLRFMAAVHRIVLEGRAPELARRYPSAGGSLEDDVWPVFAVTVSRHHDELQELMRRPCQTNEVGRSAALLGGFLVAARDTGLPLRVLEIGASAGLNLRWDHYRYEAADRSWGDPASPVRFTDVFEGVPPFDVPTEVVERAGCDIEPVDALSDEGALTLLSHTWADQTQRFERLRGALEVARLVPVEIDRADAGPWLRQRLGESAAGVATVVFHSIVMDQLDDQGRRRVVAAVEEGGQRATEEAPLAWLRMEHGYSFALMRLMRPEVWLTRWPGGEERLLARVGSHGTPVRWLAE